MVKREGVGWKIESARSAEVGQAGEDDPQNGSHHSDPQIFGDGADGTDAAIEKEHRYEQRAHGNKVRRCE